MGQLGVSPSMGLCSDVDLWERFGHGPFLRPDVVTEVSFLVVYVSSHLFLEQDQRTVVRLSFYGLHIGLTQLDERGLWLDSHRDEVLGGICGYLVYLFLVFFPRQPFQFLGEGLSLQFGDCYALQGKVRREQSTNLAHALLADCLVINWLHSMSVGLIRGCM